MWLPGIVVHIERLCRDDDAVAVVGLFPVRSFSQVSGVFGHGSFWALTAFSFQSNGATPRPSFLEGPFSSQKKKKKTTDVMLSGVTGLQRIGEQIVELPIPRITEDVGEEFKFVPQEQISGSICEQLVEVTVPQGEAIEALQLQACAISNESQEKYSGNEELLTKKHDLSMQLHECPKKMDAMWDHTAGILCQVGGLVAESGLERNMPGASEYNKKEDEMEVFDQSLSVKNQFGQHQRSDGSSARREEGKNVPGGWPPWSWWEGPVSVRIRTWQGSEELARGHRCGWPRGSHRVLGGDPEPCTER